jgi:Ca2+-binding EF-hand superfamily protein
MLLTPLILALAAAQAPAATPPTPAYSSRRGGRLFISPMGEPFRPSSRDDDSLADWFRQADRNHDGQVTLDEMQQDADRFFAILDGNHDGEIDPDEISHYENVVAPEVISGSSYGLMEAAESNEGRRRGHRHAGFIRGSEDQHQGAGRFGLLDLPEPVVSADSNFNRGVSQAEFRAAAAQRFMALDLDHRGYLTLPSLEIIRPAPPAAPNKPERPKDGDESALPDDPGL